jgi:hypothetical protein
MRQRLFIFGSVALVLVLLIAFNAATYVEIEREPDAEWNPDRSTLNAGATGTLAFYQFLSESGYQVMRWREPANRLAKDDGVKPATFVVIGALKEPFSADEQKVLLDWVKSGGRLVLVDRKPAWDLLPKAGNLQIATQLRQFPAPDVKPDNLDEMTKDVAQAKPVQPTLLTRNVEAIQPSRYASQIQFFPDSTPTPTPDAISAGTPTETSDGELVVEPSDEEPPPPVAAETPVAGFGSPPPKPAPPQSVATKPEAPVVHIADAKSGGLLVDYVHGQGRIVVLSDPFIVANGGLRSADNLQLALNLVASGKGVIAFDEYHQNRGRNQNEILAYFQGTPIVSLLAQGGLLAALFVWARGRRWARPLPLPQVDRRSKLEFVASMAELQNRARAYDLALENIYTRARRTLARYAGLSADSPRANIAANVAARSNLDADTLETLMRECEDHINGEPLSANRALELTAQLRAIEAELGLQRRG